MGWGTEGIGGSRGERGEGGGGAAGSFLESVLLLPSIWRLYRDVPASDDEPVTFSYHYNVQQNVLQARLGSIDGWSIVFKLWVPSHNRVHALAPSLELASWNRRRLNSRILAEPCDLPCSVQDASRAFVPAHDSGAHRRTLIRFDQADGSLARSRECSQPVCAYRAYQLVII